MRLSGQFKFSFFLRKDFARTKTRRKQKPTNKTKLSKKKQQRQQLFACTKTSKRGKSFFCIFMLYLRSKYSRKKNRLT